MNLNLILTALYLATVAVGIAVAYDPRPAQGRAALLAAGTIAALGIAFAGRRWGARALCWIGAACALLAAAVGAYFVLTYDWAATGAGKFAAIHEIGRWIQAHRPVLPLSEDLNGNVAGAALALLLPPAAAATVSAWRRRKLAGAALALAVSAALAGLLLTASRGAWAGLAAGAAAAALLGVTVRRTPSRSAAVTAILGLGGLILTILVVWAAIAWPGIDRLLGGATGIGHTTLSRAQLWRDGLVLAGDYLLTGSGLGGVMLVYSSYAMLLHVGFITHAHNLFLQIVLDQGLPGLLAFLALLALGWRSIALPLPAGEARRPDLGWRLAGAASLTALVVHGIVDAGLYASRLVPVLFLPIGCALACRPVPQAAGVRRDAILPIIAVAALLLIALLPATRAAVQANLAALSQTRAELSVYRWPDWPIQDALRRQAPDSPPPVDLVPAIARYRAALALDPGNVTANRRLGQIQLSLGDYAAARSHLEAAYRAAPWQRPTRQLLAEAYALTGAPAQAAALFSTVDLSQGQLELRKWWYEAVGKKW